MTRHRILVDSSIWIDHINSKDEHLVELLRRGRTVLHPMILGEIALGSIKNRAAVLLELGELPQTRSASHDDVLDMIERLKLHNSGIGFVDAHLLASVQLIESGAIWTRDKRLHAQASRLDLAYRPMPTK